MNSNGGIGNGHCRWLFPGSPDPILCNLICRMLDPDESMRATLKEVRNHEFVRGGLEAGWGDLTRSVEDLEREMA